MMVKCWLPQTGFISSIPMPTFYSFASVGIRAVVRPRVNGYQVRGPLRLLLLFLFPETLGPAQEHEGRGQRQRNTQPGQHVRPAVVASAVDLEDLKQEITYVSICMSRLIVGFNLT